jgi:DNA-binding NtrC family response regulator
VSTLRLPTGGRKMTNRALVVDDLEEGRKLLGSHLESADFSVAYAADAFDALQRIHEFQPDIVVSDFQMPVLDGVELLKRIREFSQIPVIIITAYGTIPICERAMRGGAQRFLQFRRDIDELGEIARLLLSESRSEADGEQQATLVSPDKARERHKLQFRHHLEQLVSECGGNIAEIARRLDRDRSTVRYHLRRFGLIAPNETTS